MSLSGVRRVLLLGLLVSAPSWAQSAKEACAVASEEAQRLRSEGRLLAARGQLTRCAHAECPRLVRQFCDGLLIEVTQSLPTVVFSARDGQGRDVADVIVRVDGATVMERLTGLPQPLDPGPHHLEARSAGFGDTSMDVLVLVGDRNRVLTFELAEVAPPAIGAVVALPPRVERRRPVPALVWVSSAVAVVGLGSALGLVLWAKEDEAALRKSCAPFCTEAQLAPLWAKAAWLDVTFGVGLLGVGAALVAFFSRPEVEVPLSVGLDPGTGAVRVTFHSRW